MGTCSYLIALVLLPGHVVFGAPNFVVLLADDMGYGDLSSYGNPTIKTPNIDQMAHEGIKFTQAYTGSSICSPSRGSMLTGRLPIRTGIYSGFDYPVDLLFRVFLPWNTGGLPEEEITIPKALRTKGYRSGLVGKWHCGHYNGSLPTQHSGFDYWFGLPWSQDEGCPPGYNGTYAKPCPKEGELWPGIPLYRNDEIIQQPVNLDTLTDRYTDEAIQFMQNATNNQEPFFLYMAYDQVHTPLFTSPRFAGRSTRGLFGDAAQEMDDSIGRILAAIDAMGIANDTVVFFSSDNGPWIEQGVNGGSAGPFQGGKGSTWEGGMREPFIVRWPGTVAPTQVDTTNIASLMDIFSTVLDLAGVTPPTDRVIDGVSMKNALLGQGPIDRNFQGAPVYYYYRDDKLYAVRWGPWKAHFVTRPGFGKEVPVHHDPPLMFNLNEDLGEAWPLDVSEPDVANALTVIKAAVAHIESTMVPGPPQLNRLDDKIAPCCNKSSNCYCGPW
eukprot:TRINITY_DN2755_c1_g1_i1.p1 TRINITY_DN2755_c1_g1~~TRINITY_DN2755_c1_g1_i1.p1  ORF type:complete len:496 (-),score=128.43 TRINITY_DN2755_c1_g1_i1:322-1809(-)